METETLSKTTKNEYKVFVVEDSDVYRTLLVEFISKLKKSGDEQSPDYSIHGFSSGEECLENLDLKPDVLILDYHLDGYDTKSMNGLDILKTMKKLSPETEIVILSCQKRLEVMKDLLRAGARDYINKDNISQLKVSQLIEKLIRDKEKNKHKISRLPKAIILLMIILAIIIIVYMLTN